MHPFGNGTTSGAIGATLSRCTDPVPTNQTRATVTSGILRELNVLIDSANSLGAKLGGVADRALGQVAGQAERPNEPTIAGEFGEVEVKLRALAFMLQDLHGIADRLGSVA